METISLKMEKELLKDIDSSLKNHRYSTRTEFIRDAIRAKLSDLEKEEVIKRLTEFKGSLKGKSKMSEEEASKRASIAIAEKFGIKLD